MPQPDTSAWTAGPAPDTSAWTPGPASDSERPADFTVKAEALDPNTIKTFVTHFWQNSPVALGQLLPFPKALGGSGTDHPLMPDAQNQYAPKFVVQMRDVKTQADALWKKGDYLGAATKYLESYIPFAGPAMSHLTDELNQGKYAAAAGDVGGAIVSAAASSPAASDALNARYPLANRTVTGADGVVSPAVSGPLTTPNPTVQFAQSRNIPLDAATVSDNLAVKGAQALADRSIGGSLVATPAKEAQAGAMARVGGELSAETGSTATTPEQAGLSIRSALSKKIATHEATADTAYAKAEALTPDTATVDLGRVKDGLTPLYQTLKREAELVPLQGGKARALTALDRLMNGPDQVPLMDAERATSDLGALAGSADVMRTPGQAAAAQAFSKLRQQVDVTAAQTNPKILGALQEGRAATKAKYAVADTLDTLSDEPVRAVKALTAPKDSAVQQLRAVTQHAPDQAADLARGYLEDLLDKPNKVAEWNKLGTETKAILFPKAGQAEALDQFFQLTDRISKTNVNPSGSGYIAALGAQGAMLWAEPISGTALQISGAVLSKLLRSPAAIRALTDGMKIPNTAPVAMKTAATLNLVRAAKSAGVTLDFPKAADQESPR